MEISNFLTQSFLSTFTGSIVAVEVIVAVTKELPLIKKVPTKIYTAILAFAHLLVINMSNGTLKAQISDIYCLFINSIVIAVLLCGGYDIAFGKLDVASIKNGRVDVNSAKKNDKSSIEKWLIWFDKVISCLNVKLLLYMDKFKT